MKPPPKKSKTESVKIDRNIVDKIRQVVKATGQTISGFANVELTEALKKHKK